MVVYIMADEGGVTIVFIFQIELKSTNCILM